MAAGTPTKRPRRPQAAPQPVLAAPTGMPWLTVVQQLRNEATAQQWRWSALSGLRGWREYVIGWQSAAAGTIPGVACYIDNHVVGFDRRLAWAWDQVGHSMDRTCMVVDGRTSLPSVVCAALFSELRGLGIIWPDGTVLAPVLQLATNDTALLQAQHSAKLAVAAAQAHAAAGKIRTLQAAAAMPQAAPTP